MWEPRRLTTLWAYTACYRDSLARKADNLTAICEPIVERKCGRLDVSQAYGPSRPGTEIAATLPVNLPTSIRSLFYSELLGLRTLSIYRKHNVSEI
jgi:hypothetical protein